MSRFADANDTVVVEVGECVCPGTPHAGDTATVRRQLGYAALGRIGMAGLVEGRRGVADPTAVRRRLLEEAVVAWNFLGPDGEAWPVNAVTIAELDAATVDFLAEKVDELNRLTAALPKGSAGRSPAGTRGSGSRTRTARTKSGTS